MINSVCVMGMGYVGLTLSVVLAEINYEVCGIEVNEDVVWMLTNGKPHFFEENLSIRLKQQLERKKLHIMTKTPDKHFDVFIIAVGTPLVLETKTPNLSYIDGVVAEVGELIRPGTLVCMRSTIPVGTSRSKVLPVLESKSGLKGGKDFFLAFTPERTLEGKALSELRENSQIIGGLTEACVEKAAVFFHRLTPTIVNVSSLEAAELVKIVDNTYRDIRFAYANEMAMIAEHLRLDMNEIIYAANVHYPRNNIPVPSPGVGGACLSKDPYILMDFSKKAGYNPRLIIEARRINEGMSARIVERLQMGLEKMGKDLKKSTVLIAGFAFKGNPETADIRDSTTLWLLRELRAKSVCHIKGYDPVVDEETLRRLGVESAKIPDAFGEIDILIIANNHLSYKQWDVTDIATRLNKPALIYDGWRMLDKGYLKSFNNIRYIGPGL